MDENLFEFEEEELTNPTDIKVLGVGGGGNNAVNRMKQTGVKGVEFVAVNTDAQDLKNTEADRTLQIGEKITGGLGSGADPKKGLRSAQENRDEIKTAIEGTDLLFLTAGMGGGTGTGATPVIAELAREMDILTIGVITRPFEAEGDQRAKKAEAGIKSLREYVDTLIIVPNQRIFDVINPDETPLSRAFQIADEVLMHGVHGISEVIVEDGMINLDFADVQTVMKEQGDALMGIGEASGEDAAEEAAEGALDCPLLETNDVTGARGILINIAGGDQLTMGAYNRILNLVKEKADAEAEVIAGTALRPELDDGIRVTVIATGFPSDVERTRTRDTSNVIDVNDMTSKQIDKPAFERKKQGGDVQVVEGNPEEPVESDPDEDEDLSIPTFMRVN